MAISLRSGVRDTVEAGIPARGDAAARASAEAAGSASAGTSAGRRPGTSGAGEEARATSKRAGDGSGKKTGKAAQRAHTMKVHRGVRWAIQIFFFLIATSTFSSAFAGIKYIFSQIGNGEAIEFSHFVMVLVALLAFTVVFGRFFCGYACAFGTFGDIVYLVCTPLRKLLHVKDKPLPDKAVRVLQKLKYAILVAICVLCVLELWEYVSPYSPWTAFAGIAALSVDGIDAVAFAVLLAIVAGMAVVERFFCQFLCPLGATFALMPVLPFSSFSRDRSRCKKSCGVCKKGCPVSVYPDQNDATAGECISCGKCADGCPFSNIAMVGRPEPDMSGRGAPNGKAAVSASRAARGGKAAAAATVDAGAAALPERGAAGPAGYVAPAPSAAATDAGASGPPSAGTEAGTGGGRGSRFHIRGTETWLVIVKAVLLLAIFFSLDLLDAVPSLNEVFPHITLPWHG